VAPGPLFVFFLVLAVVGGVELLDRTNFALIGLAARRPPFPAWAGAATAFVITSAISVIVGAALVAALSGHLFYLRLGGGIFLLAYAGYLAIVPEESRRAPSSRSTAVTAFLLIFLLELGDTTMILLINFVATLPDPIVVFAGGAVGLSAVAASGVLIGSRLGPKIEPHILDRLVIVILAVIGVITIVYALEPGLVPALG
jgi:putative Ca2+/H+ antiporter (TMEM165/GDT1 family)